MSIPAEHRGCVREQRGRACATAELPPALWLYWPPVVLLVLVALYPIDRALFDQMLAKDYDGGIVEHLTVLVLLPGILAGFRVLARRELLPDTPARGWVLLWTVAMIYFAGEEMSWGQWIFYWDTPEFFARINDQNETNLHNVSSWFDQKPRALVELWIVAAGLILPLRHRATGRTPQDPAQRRYWLHPTFILVPTTVLFVLVRVSEWIGKGPLLHFGSSELREYYVALFLSLYMLSIHSRARGLRAAGAGEARL